MSTTTKKIQHKFNPRATYFQGYKLPKKFMMWVPPIVEEEYFNNGAPNLMEFVYFIEASGVERIDTTIYDGFEHFYSKYIDIDKYNKPETSFCATTSEGGVGTDYIIESANSEYDNDRTITLISLDIDETGDITDVYALITFRLVESEIDTIMVETLCGNRSLPPSGEGTRLINYLTDLAYLIGIHKIALHPIDSAIGYYTRLNFIELNKDEADAINNEEGTTTFRKNTRARKNWKKAMNAVRFAIYEKKLKLNELKKNQIIIKQTYKAKYDEKTGKRGIPIHPPFSTLKQKPYVTKPVGKLVNVQRNKNGDIIKTREVYRITPGKSLRVAKMKSEIKDAAEITKIIRENAKKDAVLSTIKEESNSPEELTQEEIEQQAREFRNEEKRNALEHFINVQKQSRPKPVIIPQEEDDSVYEDVEKDDVEKEIIKFQKQEKMDALNKFEEERKKRNANISQTMKKHNAKAKGKRTHKRKPKRRA